MLSVCSLFFIFIYLFIFNAQVQILPFSNAVASYVEVRVAVGDGEHSAGVGPLTAAKARAAGRGGGALRTPGTRDRAESALSQGMLLQSTINIQQFILLHNRKHKKNCSFTCYYINCYSIVILKDIGFIFRLQLSYYVLYLFKEHKYSLDFFFDALNLQIAVP